MGNSMTCCNHPNDANGVKEADLAHASSMEPFSPNKARLKYSKTLFDNKKDEGTEFFPGNVSNNGKQLMSTNVYDSMFRKIKLDVYISNKMRGIDPQEIFLITVYIYNSIIIRENQELSKISENLIFDVQINFKKLVNEINEKSFDKNSNQLAPLLIGLLHVVVEVYHYIQYDTFQIKKNENANSSYEKNVWEGVRDIDDYFKGRIMQAAEKLVFIKVRLTIKKNIVFGKKPSTVTPFTDKKASAESFVKSIFKKKK